MKTRKNLLLKMGAEAVHDLLARLDLDELSYKLRNAAATENIPAA